ncbi:MGF factor, partial [Eudromia elegans]|nr:MGF factor [Eudromia elegans]
AVPTALLLLSLALAAPLWPALRAAPLPDVSGDRDFQLFLRKSLEFSRKIKGDVAALQDVDACLEQIGRGLRAFERALRPVRELLPAHGHLVERLQLDAANLSSNIQQQMEELGLPLVTFPAEGPGVLPTFSSPFHEQVGSFFLLRNFQRFLESALRALRHLARR